MLYAYIGEKKMSQGKKRKIGAVIWIWLEIFLKSSLQARYVCVWTMRFYFIFYHGNLTLGNVDTVLNYRGIFVTFIVLP
jgi:hypothetical protein